MALHLQQCDKMVSVLFCRTKNHAATYTCIYKKKEKKEKNGFDPKCSKLIFSGGGQGVHIRYSLIGSK